jgi:hypothetical protein
MCHFVTMVLPPAADVAAVRRVLAGHGRGFEAVENRHLAALLKPGELYVLPAPKHCDCGTALGSAAAPAGKAPDPERDAEKKRRAGWSEAKISRWLVEKEKHSRATAERAARMDEEAGGGEDWAGLLEQLRAEAGLAYTGILLHWYRGPMTERIEARRENLPVRAGGAVPQINDSCYCRRRQ